jgi:hypothetical protein
MTEENPFTVPVDTPGEEPSGSDPKELPTGMNISHPNTENHTPDSTPENASEDAPGDPVMQFVVQNFEQINAIYSAFSLKRKEANIMSHFGNDKLPVIEPWQTNTEGLPEGVTQPTPEEITLSGKPPKKNRTEADNSYGLPKQTLVTNSAFYNEPFTFKETEKNIRDLVASPFMARIRDYDMP